MADNWKSTKVLPFSGKQSDWNRWSKRFLASAAARGYREVIKPRKPDELAEEDKNVRAYSDLMNSCDDEVSFAIVEEAISSDFPEGDARKAWKNLCAKYEPKTGAEKCS